MLEGVKDPNNTALTMSGNSTESQAESDAKLFSTLCEIDKINYLFLFERCKAFHINARQLRFLEKDHIRRIIPPEQVGILAEFEYLHGEWKKQFFTSPAITATTSTQSKPQPPPPQQKQQHEESQPAACISPIRDTSMSRVGGEPELSLPTPTSSSPLTENESNGSSRKRPLEADDDEHEYLLDEIIKCDMQKVREEFGKNGILTERERRRLAAGLVDFFKTSGIYMSKEIMESLATQISTVFPTESKRAWYDNDSRQRRGRLPLKLYNMQRSKKRPKFKFSEEDDEAANDKEGELDETTMDEAVPEDDTEAERLQVWMRENKCGETNELVQMWYDTSGYRTRQFKKYITPDGEHLDEVFEKWPAYKQPNGNILINIDFNKSFPYSESIFYERWPVFLKRIQKLYKQEVRLDLYEQYQKKISTLNDETKQSILIHLLHALVRPTRPIHPKQMGRRYTIAESQNSFCKIISEASEMKDYDGPKPFLFIQGSMFNVEKVYVAFRDVRYEMDFMDALRTCLQIYFIFQLDFPLACMNFWTFMQSYFFNITPSSDTNVAVFDHIMKFLLA